jgi:hypothetical protein
MGAFPVGKHIAILEDNPERVEVMTRWLTDRLGMYDRFISDDPDTLILHIRPRMEDVVVLSLDHDLHDRPDADTTVTGMMVVEFLLTHPPAFPILIHSSNRVDADRMQRRLLRNRWHVGMVIPFDDTNWIGDDWYPAVRKALRHAGRHERTDAIDEPE